jgi:hypothetical protein
LAFLTTIIYGWEFFAGGSVLDYTYYFSYFAISIALTMASIAALVVSLARSHWSAHAGVATAATSAAVVSLGLIFRNERTDWTGRTGMKISLSVMAVAVLLVLGFAVARRTSIGTVAAAAAAGAVAATCHFAINSSSAIYSSSFSAPDNRSLYHAAIDQVAFVKRSSRPSDSLPAFWLPAAKRPDLISVQAMYYYGWTGIAAELPKVTKEMRERLALWNPQTMVMLCETRNCGGGEAALRRAGFPYAEESATRISRGRIRFWAVFLRAIPRK